MERKVTETSAKRAYILGIIGMVITILVGVAVIWFWEDVQKLEAYGYLGVFLISVFGGATILAPVPMTPVVLALGGVLKPVWVGAAAGLGETLGGVVIYITGYSGGMAFYNSGYGKIQAASSRLMGWVERRGSITLFILSAIINPFFYPAALAAGALRFGIQRYFLICWAGKTIKGLTVAYAGYWGLRGLLRLLGMPV